VAQEDRPQIMPGERKPSGKKKDVGPRALALLRLTADGKASLVPITILINGKFWDASAYKAAPIPMALESGTVYEAEQAGSSMGLFTVGAALHSNAASAPTPWIGTGSWLPAGAEAANQPHKAESVPLGIGNGDEPPRLTRNPSKETPPANTAPAAAPAPAPGPSSGDEPPRLTRPVPAQAPPASTPPASTPGSSNPGSSPQGDSKGTTGPGQSGGPQPGSSASQAEAKPPDRPKAPESDSGAGEGDRPRLRRGKPTEPLPDEEVPGYSKPGATPAANAGKVVAVAAAAGPVQLIPAISDAGGPDPRSFSFEWLKEEEGERRQQMVDLARQQLSSYLDAQAKTRITPAAAGTQTTRHKQASKPAEPVFDNARMLAYDLWTNNQPVIVFRAEAHLPPPPAEAQGGIESDLQYSILLVAYPDIYNNLHKLYAGVTDKHHLDITPRLELIDAVDADGDGRGELLFREISDAGTGWVIYRATADTLWKMYDSLNPE